MNDTLEQSELAVLGLVLSTSGQIIDDLELDPEDFYEPRYGDLYRVMAGEWSRGRPVDAFTMSEANPAESSFLFGLTSTPATASSGPYYAEIIRKHALRRRVAAAGAKLASLDKNLDSSDLADAARKAVEDAIGITGSPVRFVRDILPNRTGEPVMQIGRAHV